MRGEETFSQIGAKGAEEEKKCGEEERDGRMDRDVVEEKKEQTGHLDESGRNAEERKEGGSERVEGSSGATSRADTRRGLVGSTMIDDF